MNAKNKLVLYIIILMCICLYLLYDNYNDSQKCLMLQGHFVNGICFKSNIVHKL